MFLTDNITTKSRPTLYACENDHAAVEKLRWTIKDKVAVVTCMVDRICSERLITNAKIEIQAEPYEGEIIMVLNSTSAKKATTVTTTTVCHIVPPFGGPTVHAPLLEAQANYLTQRKLLLVNGMHTTLAFLTLCHNHHSGPIVSYDLLNSSSATEEQNRVLWVWGVARCLILLWEHDLQVIKNAHNITKDQDVVTMLLSYLKQTLYRFATVSDTTGRVLGGGIVNRYNGRLLNVHEFFDMQEAGTIPLGKMLLREAGLGIMELGYTIHSLVKDSRRIVDIAVSNNSCVNDGGVGVGLGSSDIVSENNLAADGASKNINIVGISNPIRVLRKFFT